MLQCLLKPVATVSCGLKSAINRTKDAAGFDENFHWHFSKSEKCCSCHCLLTDTQECLALRDLPVCLSGDTELQMLFVSFFSYSPLSFLLYFVFCPLLFDEHACLPPHSPCIIFYILHCSFFLICFTFFVVASLLSPSLTFPVLSFTCFLATPSPPGL